MGFKICFLFFFFSFVGCGGGSGGVVGWEGSEVHARIL